MMDSLTRKKLADRIKAMDNAQLESYINDVTEDMTTRQLRHITWYLGNKLEERLRPLEESPSYEQQMDDFREVEDDRLK